MRETFLILFCIFIKCTGIAQPLFDVASISYMAFPSKGVFKDEDKLVSDSHFEQGNLALPINLNPRHLLMINPGYESRGYTFKATHENTVQGNENYYPGTPTTNQLSLYTFYLPLYWQYTFRDSTRQLTLVAAPRINSSKQLNPGNENFLMNAAGIYTFYMGNKFTGRAGIFYSDEFFGPLWVPLFGFDWKISSRWRAWGLMPRYANVNYILNSYWHTGFTFRGIDESYAQPDQGWFRLEEVQLRWYHDFYIPKTQLVLNAEIGHTFRRRFTFYDGGQNSEYRHLPAESPIFKVSLVWRVLTDKSFPAGSSKR